MANICLKVIRDTSLYHDLCRYISEKENYNNMFLQFLEDVGINVIQYTVGKCGATITSSDYNVLHKYSRIQKIDDNTFVIKQRSSLWKQWQQYCQNNLLYIPDTPKELCIDTNNRYVSIKIIQHKEDIYILITIQYERQTTINIKDTHVVSICEILRAGVEGKINEINS